MVFKYIVMTLYINVCVFVLKEMLKFFYINRKTAGSGVNLFSSFFVKNYELLGSPLFVFFLLFKLFIYLVFSFRGLR